MNKRNIKDKIKSRKTWTWFVLLLSYIATMYCGLTNKIDITMNFNILVAIILFFICVHTALIVIDKIKSKININSDIDINYGKDN